MRGHLPRGVPLPRPVVLVGPAPRYKLVGGSGVPLRAVVDGPALQAVPAGRVRVVGAFDLPLRSGAYLSRVAFDVLPDRLCPECFGDGEVEGFVCSCVVRVAHEHGVRGVDVLAREA